MEEFSINSRRSKFFFDDEDHHQGLAPSRSCGSRIEDLQSPTHFLESCSLCKKPLDHNLDIFMYKGDVPFCSEECREKQIEIDENNEKWRNLSSSLRALRQKRKRSNNDSASSSEKKPVPTGPGPSVALALHGRSRERETYKV